MDAPTITLGGFKATLRRPSPLLALALVRSGEEMAAAEPAETYALGAAALFACWPPDVTWPAPLRPQPWHAGERVPEHGRIIFDGLLLAGVPLHPLLGSVAKPAAGDAPEAPAVLGILAAAHQWATSTILAQWEVDGAKDFCVAPSGG